jgi:hypothetical protein
MDIELIEEASKVIERFIERKTKAAEYFRNYRIANRDKYNKIREDYYERHGRENINAKAREKIRCECGSFINCNGKTNHLKTLKHRRFVAKDLDRFAEEVQREGSLWNND